jgi:hypothetical protein
MEGHGQKHNGLLVSQSMVNWGCADTLSMLARTLRQFVIRRLNVRSMRISARDTQDAGDAIHPPRDCCFTRWGSAPWDCHTSQLQQVDWVLPIIQSLLEETIRTLMLVMPWVLTNLWYIQVGDMWEILCPISSFGGNPLGSPTILPVRENPDCKCSCTVM